MWPVIIIGLAVLVAMLVLHAYRNMESSTVIVEERGDWWGPWMGSWSNSGGHGAAWRWPVGPDGKQRMLYPG